MRKAFSFAVSAVAAAGLAVAAAGTGCGNNLESEGAPQVALQQPQSGQGLSLDFPCEASNPGEPSAVRLESQGDQPLKITSVETSNTPERLLYRGEETETSCTFDSAVVPSNDAKSSCDEGQYCDQISESCVSTTLPSETITLEQDSSAEFRFFLGAANRNDERAAVNCPDPGPDVPENLQEDYCGEVTIETNAKKDEGLFTDGNITLYFQVDSSRRGVIDVVENSLRFTGLSQGESTESKEFSVRNNSPDNDLTITRLRVQEHPNLVQIEPSQTPITIGASSQQTFSVSVDVPDDFDLSSLAEDDFIDFESSAVNGCSAAIALSYTTSASRGPAILLDKGALTFGDTNPQSVQAENVGSSTLLLNRVNFEPPNLKEKYSITFDGEQIDPSQSSWANISAGESASFDVEFTGSSGGIGEMFLTHNDSEVGGQSSIVLLGSKDAGFGDVIPSSANFNYGNEETKTFVVWNRGTGELTLNPQLGSPSSNDAPVGKTNFEVSGFSDASPIPAGDVATGTIKFDGSSGMQKTQLTLEMQSDTAGDSMTITVNVTGNPEGKSLQPEITALSGDTVEVGQIARFNSADSNGNSNLSGDIWFLLDRPDGSTFYRKAFGEAQFSVRPDAAGTYKIGFAAVEDTSNGTLQKVATFELTAEEPSN